MRNGERILEALRKRPHSIDELVAELHGDWMTSKRARACTRASITKNVSRLRGKGEQILQSGGQYVLTNVSIPKDCLHFTIPVIPVAKGRPRMTRTGYVYTPKATVTVEMDIRMHLLKLYLGKPLDGPLGCMMTFHIVKPKSVRRMWPCVKPDLDNYLKALCDAGNGIIWTDDAQIIDLQARKLYAETERESRIELTVWSV